MNTKRLFVAIKIQPNINLENFLKNLKISLNNDKLNWTNLNQIHLTTNFLGETQTDKIPEIVNFIKSETDRIKSFEINISSLGIFGSRYNPKVIFLKCKPENIITDIYNSLSKKLLEININTVKGNFVPHITIARVKQVSDIKYFQSCIDKNRDIINYNQKANKLFLIESILTPKGAIYNDIAEFPFI